MENKIKLKLEHFEPVDEAEKPVDNYDGKTLCLVCGKPVPPKDAYCDEHREQALKDAEKLRDAPIEWWFMEGGLVGGAINISLGKYRRFLRRLYADPLCLDPKNSNLLLHILDIEDWIRSEERIGGHFTFRELTLNTVDPEYAIRTLRQNCKEEVEEKREQKVREAIAKRTVPLTKEIERLKEENRKLKEELDDITSRSDTR